MIVFARGCIPNREVLAPHRAEETRVHHHRDEGNYSLERST